MGRDGLFSGRFENQGWAEECGSVGGTPNGAARRQ